MTHITNLPVLHDLKFIIPHKISGERIRVRDETENNDQKDMPFSERRRPGSLIFGFLLHNFHLSSTRYEILTFGFDTAAWANPQVQPKRYLGIRKRFSV